MDISDILASVTRAHEAGSGSGFDIGQAPDSSQQEQDLRSLTRAWVSERVGPELLPYPVELMDRVMRRIRQQIENIEDRTARMDAGTSFGLVVIQTELERFKFLVRSYLRARLAKSEPQDEASPLLSPQELQYLMTHAALMERHYNASFLSSFPAKLRRLDDTAGAGGSRMVEGPDLDKAIFVRCLGVPNAGSTRNPNGRPRFDFDDEDDADMNDDQNNSDYSAVSVKCGFTTASEDVDGVTSSRGGPSQTQESRQRGVEREVQMRRGEIWMVRWSSVRDAVRRGECELI